MSSVIFDGKFIRLNKIKNRRYAEFKTPRIRTVNTVEDIDLLISELESYKKDIIENEE
ncbi:MAG: hypothetical protein ISP01_05390 [Methanobrevibacter arboriphilus]|uniref:Uncharacterized protein n=1 Tax=Methanobrevibacter arboriphilus TaxID=39441 RepID=A0A843ACV6_METAZ|nr:hypothetical protein [Methanobrevibacter arboriphilus]MBF4468822.1 hypothetical protein [Methanobrevibacter arboriphilus]